MPKIPAELVGEFHFLGSAEEVFAELEPFARAGTEHFVVAAVAGLAFLADALNYELPGGIPAIPLGTWLISIPFVLSFAYMIDFPGGGPIDRGIGLWLGLVFSAIALGLAAWAWYEDREYV